MTIHVLPLDLSNQISSGEIIERPASVIKEIIENSIDAGSKNINIEINKSGFQSILLKDDGCGINKKELLLAITRHATSKINALSDLEVISTFGFRGEALASIRAISRLTLISCNSSNNIGWKIYSEGFMYDKDVILEPIAHPKGTTIIVENLFYNIPVRLKFIQNEKLELLKIFEIIKKIALSYCDINFSLKHNKNVVLQYNAVKYKKNRLKDVFSTFNISNLIQVESKIDDISLFGWISHPQSLQNLNNIRYFYVNKRYIRNNNIINSIRSAYQKIKEYKNISFVLYLKIPPNKIDINIHPTKNEINFHESNKIYIFIYEAILFHLKQSKEKYFLSYFLFETNNLEKNKKKCLESFYLKFLTLMSLHFSKKYVLSQNNNGIKKKDNSFISKKYKQKDCFSFGNLLIVVHKYYGLIVHDDNFSLISFPFAQGIVKKHQLEININEKIIPKYILTNIKINLTSKEYSIFFKNKVVLWKFGFNLIFKKKYIILSSIPCFFKKNNINILISKFFVFLLFKETVLISDIINWFYKHIFMELKNWNYADGMSVLLDLEYFFPLFLKNPPPKLLQKININTALCMLKV
ncbi:DNA mismatch repair protein MutL [Buchnera aphidicola (Brachycaudus tragopogonis)]